jgi:hypothetical protein
MNIALVFPEEWMDEIQQERAGLHVQPCFFLIPISQTASENPKKYQKTICAKAKKLDVRVVTWFVPQTLASGKAVTKWPDLVYRFKNDYLVQSIAFAASARAVIDCLKQSEWGSQKPQHTSVFCQYAAPYTIMLEKWAKAGAKTYHPGDYAKDEILDVLRKLSGNWVYFGHALANRLRGYGHLFVNELIAHKPKKQLTATLWFTCSTLAGKDGENLALEWYLSGSTACLLASPKAIKTSSNQLLGDAWLEVLAETKNQSVTDVLLAVSRQSEFLFEVLNQYKLLGKPWVRIGM